MDETAIWIYGAIGGLLPEILRIIENRTTGKFPDFYKYLSFWIGLILMVAIGSFCAHIFNPNTAVNAVALGFTAPKILSELVGTPEKCGEELRNGGRFSLREWWG